MGGPFRYASVENGDACYCGDADNKFIPTDPEECNIPCTGDPNQFCGSSWRLQVYDTKDSDDDHHEYTEARTQGPTTTSQPETTTQATPNAVLVLSTNFSSNKPMIVTFDGKIFIYLYHFLKTHIQGLSMTILISNMEVELKHNMAVV